MALAKVWQTKMTLYQSKSNTAKKLYESRTILMNNAETSMISAVEAQARAEERMKVAITESAQWKIKMEKSNHEMNAQKTLCGVSMTERSTMLSKYMHSKQLLIKANAKFVEATRCRVCAEVAAKKRLHMQAIYLTKWMLSFKVKQIAMHTKMVRAKELALVSHQHWISICKLLVKTTTIEEKNTAHMMIEMHRQIEEARHKAIAMKKMSLSWISKRDIAIAKMHHVIRLRETAHHFMMTQREIQMKHVIKAKAIRLAVHHYIMKVRSSHAHRNFLFDTKQCKQMKHTLHGLYGKHDLASRQAAMHKARAFWCAAASCRQVQMAMITKGNMKAASMNRGKCMKHESLAREMHNYVWIKRVDTCKGKCIKYKDWLKIVTALAKAMAMKPCGKIPNAPVNGV
jgi:hypothetical protein